MVIVVAFTTPLLVQVLFLLLQMDKLRIFLRSLIKVFFKAEVALEVIEASLSDLVQVLIVVPFNGLVLSDFSLRHVNAVVDLLLHLDFFLMLRFNEGKLLLLL